MSELRQRNVAASKREPERSTAPLREAAYYVQHGLTSDLTGMLGSMRNPKTPGKIKGLTNETKEAREALLEDPYNLELIHDLGIAYFNESKWEQCANVLIRGWKRFDEFDEPEVGFQFLFCLLEASMKTNKYRQALAVLDDMEVENPTKGFLIITCQVYSKNGEMQKAIKAFNGAIEDEPFGTACLYWAQCRGGLAEVGACATTRSTLAAMAITDEDRRRLKEIEKIAELKENMLALDDPSKGKSKQIYGIIGWGLFVVVMLAVILTRWEASSLSTVKFRSLSEFDVWETARRRSLNEPDTDMPLSESEMYEVLKERGHISKHHIRDSDML